MAIASSSTDQPSPEKVAEYKKAIERHGDIDSMNKLATLLVRGTENLPADPRSAHLLYQRAVSEGNHLPSMLNLASLLHAGYEDVPPDSASASDIYEIAIDEYDDPVALCKRALLILEDIERTMEDEERALDYLQRSAGKGYANSIGELGLMYQVGWGSYPRDLTRAALHFRKAIDVGRITNSMYYLAWLVLEGYDDVPPDPDEAIGLLQQAIDEGNDTDAMILLAKILRDGLGGLAKDWDRAVELLERAVEADHSSALYNLAGMYMGTSDESKKDAQKAVSLFERSIRENEDRHAMFKMGIILKDGFDEIPPDAKAAADLFERAVNEGNHIHAMAELSSLLRTGAEGLPKDDEKASELLRQLDSSIQVGPRKVDEEAANLLIHAAEQRDSYAEMLVGIHFKFGDEPFGLDKVKALKMLRNSADAGNSEAMFHLGMMLMDGLDEELEADMPKAMTLFRKAANECNNLASINVLASFLLEGYRDIETDVEQAVKYLERAVELGDTHSMNRLAMLHFEGCLLTSGKSSEKAVALFKKAIDAGDFNAAHNLAVMERNGNVTGEKNDKEAVRLLDYAIEKRRHFRSMITMTDLCLSGWEGVKPDSNRAAELIEEAVEMGDMDSGNLHTALYSLGYEDEKLDEMGEDGEYGIDDIDDESIDYNGRATMFKESILKGNNPVSYYALGCLVQESQADICADSVGAARWFQRAVDINGHAPSAMALAHMLLVDDDDDLPRDVERAKTLLKVATENGHAEASILLTTLA